MTPSPAFWTEAVRRQCDPDALAPRLGLSAFECAALMARARARLDEDARRANSLSPTRRVAGSGTLRSSWLARATGRA